jgi:hypothetical protein
MRLLRVTVVVPGILWWHVDFWKICAPACVYTYVFLCVCIYVLCMYVCNVCVCFYVCGFPLLLTSCLCVDVESLML